MHEWPPVLQVRLSGEFGTFGGADHVGDDLPVGGVLDAEVAIIKKLAQAAFEEAGAQAPSDQLIAVYISQCIQALERGISKDWRGVLEMTEK
jgi:hypothetical protein